MSPVFVRNGMTWRVSNEDALVRHKTLPAANYTVCVDSVGDYFLEVAESFKLPSKLYGSVGKHADRILTTFRERPAITGAMLEGEKGSGKTLLAKKLSVLGAMEGIPTLLVNDGEFNGSGFNQFIQSIEQPAIILFDEFEKVYEAHQQENMLSFLDGMYPTKKLCVFTVNNRHEIDSHMMNRPGRLFYMLSFDGLDDKFIREFCQDRLLNKKHIDNVCSVAGLFHSFNFDQLQALVEEMNRYDESPMASLEMLNIKPELDSGVKFDVELRVDGKKVTTYNDEFEGTPFSEMQFNWDTGGDDDDGTKRDRAVFTPGDFVSIQPRDGVYTFKNKAGDQLRLTRKKELRFAYPRGL